MKLTKHQLKKIIKEELEYILDEQFNPFEGHGAGEQLKDPGWRGRPMPKIGIRGPTRRSLEATLALPKGERSLPMSKEEKIDADIEAALYPQPYQETDVTQGPEGMPVRLVQRSRVPGTHRRGETNVEAGARLGWARTGVPYIPGRTSAEAAIGHGFGREHGYVGGAEYTPGVGLRAGLQERIIQEVLHRLMNGVR